VGDKIIPSLLWKLVILISIQNKEIKTVRIVINQEKVLICALQPKSTRNQTILPVEIFAHSFLVDCLILAHSYAFLFIVIALPFK
jgi:hypothetical protein